MQRPLLAIFSIFVIINLTSCTEPDLNDIEIKRIGDKAKVKHVEIRTKKYEVELGRPDGVVTGIVEKEHDYNVKVLRKMTFE